MLASQRKYNDKTLNDLLVRIEKLEHAIFGDKASKKLQKPANQQSFKGATGGIRLLISNGFFDKKKNFGEIKEALTKAGYHYSNQAIQTPLNNLSRSGGPLVGFKQGGHKVYAKRK